MKFIKNNLAVLALIAGTLGAFAFQAPKEDPEQMLFGRLPSGQWVPAQDGATCDGTSGICKAQLVNNDPQLGQIIPGTEVPGIYNTNP